MVTPKRPERLRDQIKKVVSEIIQSKVSDPHIGFITITDVELSKDYQFATVFYSVYGDTDSRRETKKALGKARGFIQSELAREIRIRRIPQLQFAVDNSVERGLRVQELLDKIDKESEQQQANDE